MREQQICGSGRYGCKQTEDRQLPQGYSAWNPAGGSGLPRAPGAFGALAGKGTLVHCGFRPQQGLQGLVPLCPGLFHSLAGGVQVDNRPPEPSNGVVFGNMRLRNALAQRLCALLCGKRLGCGLMKGLLLAGGLPAVVLSKL